MPKTPLIRRAQGAAHRVGTLLVDAVMAARAMDVATEEPAGRTVPATAGALPLSIAKGETQ